MSVITEVLAPFEIWEIQIGPRTLKFYEPLVLQPHWLEDDPNDPDSSVIGSQYLGVERPELEIFSFGSNRRELWNCILGDIRSAWTHIVQVDEAKLSPHGKKVKEQYLALAEEVQDE
ncbi:MAG: hypothetical protein ACRC10_11790 [Thermoguttaceae bacterium]